ncbi:uncharacterized protein LOC131930614 [Physella acuta]|uniref:uncharacterized protein LOC131930614 n=1 Tax=Physella acuta TaxID=109671 RepID=UPI0027DB824A|nr:uncharacterized protein LOC131930614 [Physella acuta]
MAPKLKLIYFNARGRAEVSRLLLALGGQEYEDVRIPIENWPEEKPKTVFGQVPMLEVDGVRYAQSVAIEAYLARELNLYGESNLDQLKIDQVVQLNQDYRAKAVTGLKETDEARKAELIKKVKEVESPLYLGFLEKLLKENGTGYFVGSSLSYADISTYDNIYAFSVRGPLLSRPGDDYPLLKELFNNVENNERIKAYLANRKQTDIYPQQQNTNMKLIYFDARGRAEISRLLLAAAGKEYEDVRLPRDQWTAEKPNTPFGQLPVLEVKGKRFGQSLAIAMFLARKLGFYGKDELDGLAVDQVVQLSIDFGSALGRNRREKDEAKKAELLKQTKEVDVPKFVTFYEKILRENGTGYFVGDSLTLADIVVFDQMEALVQRGMLNIEQYPLVQTWIEKVKSNEKLRAYLESRKPSEH